MKQSTSPKQSRQGGFTLTEMLLVVAIIILLTAVAAPPMINYFRTYQIRGATQQVAGEIQAARHKAIARNVNYGVVFVVLDAARYRWASEDVYGAASGARPSVATALNDPTLSSPERTLPTGVMFATTCPGFAANDSGFRFNRLGGWCDPSGTSSGPGQCPDLGTGALLVQNLGSGSTVCLAQVGTNLNRTITVAPGGRVMAQQ